MKNLLLSALAAYIMVGCTLSLVLLLTGDERPLDIPLIGECETELDCPSRMFCYAAVPKSFITNEPDDVETVEDVCGCYGMFGEKGFAEINYEGGLIAPDGGYCQSSHPYKSFLTTITVLLFTSITYTAIQLYRTLHQLVTVDSFNFNASGIVLTCTVAACTFEMLLFVIYILEMQALVQPSYKALDMARPILFGFYTVAQLTAILNVSLMWSDVYQKSKSLKAELSTIPRLKKIVAAMVFMTACFCIGGLATGNTSVSGLWISVVSLGVAYYYKRDGTKLGNLLMPKEADVNPDANLSVSASRDARKAKTPAASVTGAASAKLAASQIILTANFFCFVNILFVLFLVFYSWSVQHPSTNSLSMLMVLGFNACGNAQQVRIMDYIRFGSRKKLVKGGYGDFRSHLFVFLCRRKAVSPAVSPTVPANTASAAFRFATQRLLGGGGLKTVTEGDVESNTDITATTGAGTGVGTGTSVGVGTNKPLNASSAGGSSHNVYSEDDTTSSTDVNVANSEKEKRRKNFCHVLADIFT